jgi:phosphate transport system permease protein
MKVNQRVINKRIVSDWIFRMLVIGVSCLCAVPLILILYFIAKQGFSAISLSFLTNNPHPVGEPGGGVLNAIIGSGLLLLTASVIAIPVGVFAGVFISEYRTKWIAKQASFAAEILQGVPSIVIGIIAYIWVVRPMGHFSAFSGGIALAMMMLPVIIRTTEETMRLIPNTIKEASLALGVPYYKTILKVVIPSGFSGIITGIILSLARVAGETAPLLFTAFGNPYLTFNVLRPVQSLPLTIFTYATSPYEDWKLQAWGASFVLLLWILIINLALKFFTRRWKIQF